MVNDVTWRRLYPFESHYLALDDARMHFLDEGTGAPLLMVHGNPTWSFYWRSLVESFRDRYRTVVPDHIGCGLSDKPQRYEYRLARHVDNLCRLIEHLELKGITLLVHDWGGAIGLGAATRLPHRFARLVLFNTGAFPPPFIPLRIRLCRTPIAGTLAVRGCNAFARAALWMATARRDRLTRDVRAGLLAPYDSWSHRIAIDRFVRDIPASPRHPTWGTLAEIESQLPRLSSLPTKIIWGMRDWCFTCVCLERFESIFAAADVSRLPGAAHYVVEDAHDDIVPLLADFFAAHPVRPAERATS